MILHKIGLLDNYAQGVKSLINTTLDLQVITTYLQLKL